jgi:hypothetical protein
VDDPNNVTPSGEEATKQEQGRAQVGALVALANSVKTCGQMKHATIEQTHAFLSAVPALMAEASRLLEVRAQQSASGRSSAGRRVAA